MSSSRRFRPAPDASRHAPATAGLAPGRRAPTDQLQRRATSAPATPGRPERSADGAPDIATVEGGLGDTEGAELLGARDRAWAGTAGPGEPLPHRDRIQVAFGRHDVGTIEAHVGGAAADASADLGAEGYAIGNHVAFRAEPGLHTAAHEAAHVVQQRAGVQLAGGVGATGDRHEQHADAVADAVVRGAPAEPLLDELTGAGGEPAVQRQETRTAAPDGFDAEPIRQRLLALGVAPDEIGDLSPLAGWDGGRLARALALLDDLDHGRESPTREGQPGSRGRRGAEHRPVRAWNVHLDDLGAPGPRNPGGRYRNILEFVDNLDRLAGPGGYLATMRAMPTVRLAGAPVAVHPRALFFAAAAQAEMDRLAGRAAGEGHYIPAGAFRRQLIDITRILRQVAEAPRPARRRRPAIPPLPEGPAIVAAVTFELRVMVRVLADQERNVDTVPGYHHDEHREPGLRRYMSPCRDTLAGFTPATDPAGAAEDATMLLTALGDVREDRETRGHGAGSVDAHGTEHAMGTAVDLHHGRRWWQNFAPTEAYWPFIHHVIEQSADRPEVAALGHPDSIGDLQPSQGRLLSALMRERGPALALDLLATDVGPPQVVRDDRQRANQVQRLRRQIHTALRSSARRLRQLSRPRQLRRVEAPLHDDLARTLERLEHDVPVVPDANVVELSAIVHENRRRLLDLEQHLDRVGGDGTATDEAPAPRRADPVRAAARAPHLDRLSADLDDLPQDIEDALRRHEDRRLREIVARPGFQRWLEQIGDPDTPLYDQPDVMVAGLTSVEGSHFYGGHHWEIAPLPGTVRYDRSADSVVADTGPSLVTSSSSYEEQLAANLRPRPDESPADASGRIERTLLIMAESPGGRSALFGSGPTSGLAAQDPVLYRALAASPLGDVDAVLERLRHTMVDDYAGASQASRDMRDLGFHGDAGVPAAP